MGHILTTFSHFRQEKVASIPFCRRVTDANGCYEFEVLDEFDYTVQPYSIDNRFAPFSGTVSWPDKPTQNFIMRPYDPEPFLDLPFEPTIYEGFTEQESFAITISGNIDRTGESGKVNSWFDHDEPIYTGDDNSDLLRWDGALKPNPANVPCSMGDNCYDGHDGIDFHLAEGVEIHAPCDGMVVYTSSVGPLGNHVILDHNNGYFTVYGHLQIPSLVSGVVHKGDIIGRVGSTGNSTGPHLHFAVYYDFNGTGTYDRYEDKVVDPFGWKPSTSDPWLIRSEYLWVHSNSLQCTIPPEGSTQTSPTGFWTTYFPAGAVPANATMEMLENPPYGSPLSNLLFAGQSISLSLFQESLSNQDTDPTNAVSSKNDELLVPAIITVKYFPAQLSHHDLNNLSVYQWDDTNLNWYQLVSVVNSTDQTVTAQTTSLGQFVLKAPRVCTNAVHEPNDNYDAATYLVENSDPITDNFDIESDEDWFRLRANNSNKYEISITEDDPGVDVLFELYDEDGVTLLLSSNDPSTVEWFAPDGGTYFVRIVRQSGGVFGCQSNYSIGLTATYFNFMPLIQN